VRIPSAWNDLVGLKTTHGRLSVTGVVALCAQFDTVGPLCRSVEDAGLLLAILEGSKPADLAGASLKGARFAIIDTLTMDSLRDAPRAAFESAVQRLQVAGATVTHIQMPEIHDAFDQAFNLYAADSYGHWRDLVDAHPEKMFPQILERVRGGQQVSGADYVASWIKLHAVRKIYAAHLAGFDAFIMPTAPNMPPNAARLLTAQYADREPDGRDQPHSADRRAVVWDHVQRGPQFRREIVADRGSSGQGTVLKDTILPRRGESCPAFYGQRCHSQASLIKSGAKMIP
jgi:aspartyl-tRNA(Asn)/glutamyl-tRNA(Gln) amidotransferase subunit A